MSDIAIFIAGVFVTVLLSGGVVFTFREFRRLDEEALNRREANARAPGRIAGR